jgi:hypothetical protein
LRRSIAEKIAMQWIIFAALATVAVATLVNEFAFGGKLFPSSAVAFSAGLLAIAMAAGVTILGRYRNKIGIAARDIMIWISIIAVIIGAYWLFQ